MKIKRKDGKVEVYWKILESTWDSIVRVSMERHITPERLVLQAIRSVT